MSTIIYLFLFKLSIPVTPYSFVSCVKYNVQKYVKICQQLFIYFYLS